MTGDLDAQRQALELAWQLARLSKDEHSEQITLKWLLRSPHATDEIGDAYGCYAASTDNPQTVGKLSPARTS